MTTEYELIVHTDTAVLENIVSRLEQIAENDPESVETLLSEHPLIPELFATNSDCRFTGRTGDLTISFKPTQCLLDFLSAFGTFELDRSLAQI